MLIILIAPIPLHSTTVLYNCTLPLHCISALYYCTIIIQKKSSNIRICHLRGANVGVFLSIVIVIGKRTQKETRCLIIGPNQQGRQSSEKRAIKSTDIKILQYILNYPFNVKVISR